MDATEMKKGRKGRSDSCRSRIVTTVTFLPVIIQPKVTFRDLFATVRDEPVVCETTTHPTCKLGFGKSGYRISIKISSIDAAFAYKVCCIDVKLTGHNARTLATLATDLTLSHLPTTGRQRAVWV